MGVNGAGVAPVQLNSGSDNTRPAFGKSHLDWIPDNVHKLLPFPHIYTNNCIFILTHSRSAPVSPSSHNARWSLTSSTSLRHSLWYKHRGAFESCCSCPLLYVVHSRTINVPLFHSVRIFLTRWPTNRRWWHHQLRDNGDNTHTHGNTTDDKPQGCTRNSCNTRSTRRQFNSSGRRKDNRKLWLVVESNPTKILVGTHS